jgi:hypothetical protein
MMQLMPGTAREVAGKMGLGYDAGRLLRDPDYNIQMGSHYFAQLMNSWGGNAPLAVASYNAGAGNVRKWIREYGDPRMPGGDIVAWIEQIPFSETRGYVQRVLENAVVYDTLNPVAGTGAAADAAFLLSRQVGPARVASAPMAEKTNYITPAGYRRLREEYEALYGVERPRIVETISWAAGKRRSLENGDYNLWAQTAARDRPADQLAVEAHGGGERAGSPQSSRIKGRVFFGAKVTWSTRRIRSA